MRALAISVAVATALLLLTGGRLIFIPLLFVPLGLLNSRRVRALVARAKTGQVYGRPPRSDPQ